MNAFIAIFLLSVGFAAGLAAARVYQLVLDLSANKEGWKHEHVTHRNAMTIENVIAQAIRARLDMEEAAAMLNTQIEILQNWRTNPGYNPEKPVNGQK